MKTEKKNKSSNVSNQYYLKLLSKFQNQRKNRESFKSLKILPSNTYTSKYQPQQEIPYSIKPLNCTVPKDVNIQKIMVNMMKSSFKINDNKSIYKQMSSDDLKKRNEILNNIKYYLIKKSVSKKILCAIIFLYDILIIKNTEKKIFSLPEEIGIGALLLTLKFVLGKKKSVYKYIYDIFPNEKIVNKDINEIEINSLKLIDYYLNYASPISFMELFFINGIIFSTDKIKNEFSGKIYELLLDLTEKIMIISNEYIKYNPLCLCSCIVAFARDIYNLEKWPQILSQAFGVTFHSFENIYNEFYEDVMDSFNNKNDMNYDYNNSDLKLNKNKFEVLNKHRSQAKLEDNRYKKYINNKYNSINNNISNKVNSEIGTRNKNNTQYQIKGFLADINKESKEYKENLLINPNNTNNNISNNKYDNYDIKIPSFTAKKNIGFKSIFENKINENLLKSIKGNKYISFKIKEQDYSNLATAENSNNFNRNYYSKNKEINTNISSSPSNNNTNKDSDYNDRYILNDNNISYKKGCISFTTQKKYPKKYERWSSIKKYCKVKNDDDKE